MQAGGWSIVTLREFPAYTVAGMPLTLTFSVRQHGVRLVSGLTPAIRATGPDRAEKTAVAVPTRHQGEYSAVLHLDSPGEWRLRVDSGFNPDDTTRGHNSLVLPALTVVREVPAVPSAHSERERGGRLIVTKGCVGCHTPGSQKNITRKPLSTEYLKSVLADPGIRTPDMPNLGLRDTEISALIAFINAPRDSAGR